MTGIVDFGKARARRASRRVSLDEIREYVNALPEGSLASAAASAALKAVELDGDDRAPEYYHMVAACCHVRMAAALRKSG